MKICILSVLLTFIYLGVLFIVAITAVEYLQIISLDMFYCTWYVLFFYRHDYNGI